MAESEFPGILWSCCWRKGGEDTDSAHGVVVDPGMATALRVPRGSVVRVTDLEGEQVGGLVAFVHGDREEWLSMAHTRSVLGRICLRLGDTLFSNLRRPLLRLTCDDGTGHDLLHPACDPERYQAKGAHAAWVHANCRTALFDALGSVPYERIPDPLNVFMNSRVLDDGVIEVRAPLSRAGSRCELTALRDLVIAVSSCPMEMGPCNGGRPTPLLVEVVTPSLASRTSS